MNLPLHLMLDGVGVATHMLGKLGIALDSSLDLVETRDDCGVVALEPLRNLREVGASVAAGKEI